MIRVVIAEDTYLVREGIRRLLEPEADIELVAACADLPSLLEAIEAEQPDVVLTDIRMPPSDQDEGIQVAAGIVESARAVGSEAPDNSGPLIQCIQAPHSKCVIAGNLGCAICGPVNFFQDSRTKDSGAS